MGATLPAIARWVETTPTGVSWLGFFYGSNIAGAVFGCLLAGFYLLRVHDMTTTTVRRRGDQLRRRRASASRCRSARRIGPRCRQSRRRRSTRRRAAGRTPSTSRSRCPVSPRSAPKSCGRALLSLMLGASVYTFSIILAVFLIGLGFGSSAGSFLARGCAAARGAGLDASCCSRPASRGRRVMMADSLPVLADQSVAVARVRGSRSRWI